MTLNLEKTQKSYKLRTFNFKFPLKHPDIIKKNLNYDNFCANINVITLSQNYHGELKKKLLNFLKSKNEKNNK